MTENTQEVLEKNEEADVADPSFLECLADAEDLIDKCPMRTMGCIGERMFHLSNGSVIFGLLLAETPDSFVLSYPTVLYNTDGKISGRLVMETIQTRMFKSSIVTMSKPSDIHRFYYFKFLMEGTVEVPSMLNGKRLERVISFMSAFKDKVPSEKKADDELVIEEGDDLEVNDDVPSIRIAPYRKKTRH
jgi:hypothetical protein